MLLIHQNCTTSGLRRVPLHLTSASSIAPDTAATASRFQVSKRGAAYVSSTTSLVAIGNGAYYAQLATGHTDTVGFLLVRAKTSKTAEAQTVVQIVPWNPNLDTSDRLRVQVHGLQSGVIVAGSFANDSLTSRIGAAGWIHPTALATGAVHRDALASAAIRTNVMASGSVRSNVIASGAIRHNTLVDDALTSRIFGANSLTSRVFATGAITATSLSNAAATKVADIVLRRNLGNAATSAYGQTASGRNLLQASRKHANRVLLSASLAVYKENDTTVAFRQAITLATGLASEVITDLNTV